MMLTVKIILLIIMAISFMGIVADDDKRLKESLMITFLTCCAALTALMIFG